MLLEYECALIQNAIYGTPVLPVFLGEAEVDENGDKGYSRFNRAAAAALSLPNSPHSRKANAQSTIDNLSRTISAENKGFLNSISKTLEKVYELQGCHVVRRGEDQSELDNMVTILMKILQRRSAV